MSIDEIIYSNGRRVEYLISIQMEIVYFLITLFISGWLCYFTIRYDDFELLKNFVFSDLLQKIIKISAYILFAFATIKLIKLVIVINKIIKFNDEEEFEKLIIERSKKTKLNLCQRKRMDRELLKIENIIGKKACSELIQEVKKRSGKDQKNAYFYYVLFFEYFDIMKNNVANKNGE